MRLNVGAVITRNNRIVSIGYNGTPPKKPHCLGNDCPGKDHCTLTIHAERNALFHLPQSVEPEDLYVTDSPCEDCTQDIVGYGIKRLFFQTPYRLTNHLSLLFSREIPTYQIMPTGIIIDYFTREIQYDL
jgi:dCMP deaminase